MTDNLEPDVLIIGGGPGGFLAGIAHTAAARIDDDELPSPADPMSGAAVLLRPLR